METRNRRRHVLRRNRNGGSVNNCKIFLFVAIIFASVSCQSAGTRPCTGYAKGPRLKSFGIAALPADHGPLLRPDMGAIIGSVADMETGGGVPRATVMIRLDSASRVLAFTTADTLGGFALADVPVGTYLLSARGITYPEAGIHLGVKQGVLDTARIALRFYPLYLSCESITTS